MKSSHRITVVHGVERGDLIDTHRRHLQQPRDLIHDTYACEAVLALAKVENRHHGGFLVLRRVALEDFGDELLVDGIELKGDFRVILWCISVLGKLSARGYRIAKRRRTTWRTSLLTHAVVARNRHCGRLAVFNGCTIQLESRDSGFNAILIK